MVGRDWPVRSITGMTRLPGGGGERPAFQQLEVLRSLHATTSTLVAVGGGLREEWDGTRVLIGRAFAATHLAGGRLQGSVVLERADAASVRRDAADLVTSVGWSRRAGRWVAPRVGGVAP